MLDYPLSFVWIGWLINNSATRKRHNATNVSVPAGIALDLSKGLSSLICQRTFARRRPCLSQKRMGKLRVGSLVSSSLKPLALRQLHSQPPNLMGQYKPLLQGSQSHTSPDEQRFSRSFTFLILFHCRMYPCIHGSPNCPNSLRVHRVGPKFMALEQQQWLCTGRCLAIEILRLRLRIGIQGVSMPNGKRFPLLLRHIVTSRPATKPLERRYCSHTLSLSYVHCQWVGCNTILPRRRCWRSRDPRNAKMG
jgi:hypothetical protein